MDAIAEVYSSTFSPDPIEYRRERGLLDFNEEMGILVQEVVGTKIGPYYMPIYAGVAFSRNEFRWSPRIRREDGMIRLVPGLGTRAVDRVGNDYPILISPFRPELQVNALVEERIRYSPRYMDVINLETGLIETVEVDKILRNYADQIPSFDKIVSVHEHGRLVPPNIMCDTATADLVITFQNLFDSSDFLPKMKRILSILEEKLESPVDVEFACDGKSFFFLQCRPQSQSRGMERIPVPKDIPRERKLFTARRFVTTGQIENIEYIVYVSAEDYGALDSREKMLRTAKIIGELNIKLPKRKFILMGPGRWGSRGDIKLGVPVRYADINNTALLVEIAKEKGDYTPEISFGTHFFQDLVEANIRYLPLYPDQPDIVFNEELLLSAPNRLGEFCNGGTQRESIVRVLRISDILPSGTLSVVMDGDAGEALAYFKPPDHWNWRVQKVKEIAKQLDPELYGVEALYVIGSTKDGGAGPASDIDLLVHFRGTEDQREKLLDWFASLGKRLDEENTERTGIKTGGLLDVHIITDEDIRNKTSWATHIASPYLTALKVPLEKEPI
jgi:predicted nucleotidyltransferase